MIILQLTRIGNLMFLFIFFSFSAMGQGYIYFSDRSNCQVLALDTTNFKFEYFSKHNIYGACKGSISKISKTEYKLICEPDLTQFPLQIVALENFTQLNSSENILVFNYSYDSSVTNDINFMKKPFDSSIVSNIKAALIGAVDTEVLFEIKKAKEQRPAFHIVINDSIDIPLINDTLVLDYKISSLYVYSRFFGILSQRYAYTHMNCCNVIDFDLKKEYYTFPNIKNKSLLFVNKSKISLRESSGNIYFRKISRAAAKTYISR